MGSGTVRLGSSCSSNVENWNSKNDDEDDEVDNNLVATGVVNLPMPPLYNAFRITVDSHYSLAGQSLCIMSTRWPYRRFPGLRNLGFSAATFQFCIS